MSLPILAKAIQDEAKKSPMLVIVMLAEALFFFAHMKFLLSFGLLKPMITMGLVLLNVFEFRKEGCVI